MSDKVLSTKVSEDEMDDIRSLAEEKGETISSLLRKLLNQEIKQKQADWDAECFGDEPRDDEPEEKDKTVDEVLYGR